METKNEKDYDSLMLSNLRNSEKYRIEKRRADETLRKYNAKLNENDKLITQNNILIVLFVLSLITNLYLLNQ